MFNICMFKVHVDKKYRISSGECSLNSTGFVIECGSKAPLINIFQVKHLQKRIEHIKLYNGFCGEKCKCKNYVRCKNYVVRIRFHKHILASLCKLTANANF